MIRTLENMRSVTVTVLRCLVNNVDFTKYSILGCSMTVRNARRASQSLLPKMVAQMDASLEKPRRAREYDIFDETEFDGEEFEQIETGLNEYAEGDLKRNRRKEMAEKKFIKRKIVEKKLFKPPVVPNILSWSTKEQIRLLNKENPEEWTVDKLVDSFPTSRDSVIRILKSKYKPRNDVEIARHDNRALKNLLELKSTLPSDKITEARNLLSKTQSDGSSLMVKAGIKPENSVLQMHRMGVFEAIVKDYAVKDGSEKHSYEHAPGRNTHHKTQYFEDHWTTESKMRGYESKKHWNPTRWQQKLESSKDEFKPRGKQSKDEDNYHFAANTRQIREKSGNHQPPQRHGQKYVDASVDPYGERDDREFDKRSHFRFGNLGHKASTMTRDERSSKTRFSKEHENDPSLDNDRVVYDENGEFLYRIP